MKVLVLGSGAREHALVWKIIRSELVEKVFAFPGNAGIAEIAQIPQIENSSSAILAFAEKEKIGLVVIGPENYLAAGMADLFVEAGISVFGVNKLAAMLESSKAFAKEVMKEAKIPTARYFTVESYEEGAKILKSMPYPIVLKADGLAAGKGVVITDNPVQAETELKLMLDGRFADAGKKVVIEEFLRGEELSLILFVDKKSYRALEFSQDHKAILDGDKGANTGGMGAYLPVSIGTKELYGKIEKTVIKPLLETLEKKGIEYRGALYIGLMICDNEPFVLEFNARFGDPETEPLTYMMKSDIVPYLVATAEGKLEELPEIQWNEGYGVTVVIASEGYPEQFEKGFPIEGLDKIKGESVVFHAGTSKNNEGAFVNNGGRVLMVTSNGETIEEAIKNVYTATDLISFKNAYFRKDIAHRELKRVKKC